MARLGGIDTQFFDGNGDPLSGGFLYFYEAGTSTPKATYSDEALTIENENPVELDAFGVPGDIFFTGTARIVLTDADDVQIRVMDPVDACCATEGGGGAATDYWTFVFPAKTANFSTASGSFYFVDVDTAAADVTMTLPTSPAANDRVGYAITEYNINYNVITDGGANDVVMGGAGFTTVEPLTSLGYWGYSFVYSGSAWYAYDSYKVNVDG